MLDRDESALHAVQLGLHGRALLDSDEAVLADIRDARRIRQVFERFRPQIVFHAAALKHLPLLERYPAEALKTNVWGTLTVLEAAAACGVESFVNISTDKAANPVERAWLLQAARRAAHRAHGQSGMRHLPERPVRQRPGQPGIGADRAERPGGRGRPGNGHPPRGQPVLHDRRRSGAARAPGGCHRPRRRGPRPRHGRAGADRRHRPAAGGRRRHARSTSCTPACARARSSPRTCWGSANRTNGPGTR